jgi:hypothetical protein
MGGGLALIHGFVDQAELLRLLALCAKDLELKIITPLGHEWLEQLPILSLGLRSVEIVSEADARCQLAPMSAVSVLQGSNVCDAPPIQGLNEWIAFLSSGGTYTLLFNSESVHYQPPGSACSPASYLSQLSEWLLLGSPGCPPDQWWPQVQDVTLGAGYAILKLSRAFPGPVLSSDSSLEHERAQDVLTGMQAEIDRVFNLYSSAYQVADCLRDEKLDLQRRLSRACDLGLGCQQAMLRLLTVTSRLMASLGEEFPP